MGMVTVKFFSAMRQKHALIPGPHQFLKSGYTTVNTFKYQVATTVNSYAALNTASI